MRHGTASPRNQRYGRDLYVFHCSNTDSLQVDYQKLADRCGMSNVRSASNAWSNIKKKIMARAGGGAAKGENGEATPKKTPKKRGKAAAAAEDGDEGESPTKKQKDRKGKAAKEKEESDGADGADGGLDDFPVKAENEDE